MKDYVFRTVGTSDEAYTPVVEFSLQAYETSVLGHIRQATPHYICMLRHERLSAVCGFRGARGGLFLEQFMEESAEQYVAVYEGAEVARNSITELGAFRVKSPALAPLFAAQIERALLSEGFTHGLALSPSGIRSVADWSKKRVSMPEVAAAGGSSSQNPGGLQVCVLRLERAA